MANITAKDVAALRERTGVGMMDCKKALVEAEGDFEKAIVILREKGLATQAKKAGRVAAEGLVVDVATADCGTPLATTYSFNARRRELFSSEQKGLSSLWS